MVKGQLLTTNMFTYNDANKLMSARTPASAYQFGYDALGQRIIVSSNGAPISYVHDVGTLGRLTAEYNDTGTLQRRFEHGHGLLSSSHESIDSLYWVFDALGSTSDLLNSTGEVVGSYAYAPFGKTMGAAPRRTSFGFHGELGVVSDMTGLTCMGARYYSEEQGRFVSNDPAHYIDPLAHPYAFALNNPISLVDPLGLASRPFWQRYERPYGPHTEEDYARVDKWTMQHISLGYAEAARLNNRYSARSFDVGWGDSFNPGGANNCDMEWRNTIAANTTWAGHELLPLEYGTYVVGYTYAYFWRNAHGSQLDGLQYFYNFFDPDHWSAAWLAYRDRLEAQWGWLFELVPILIPWDPNEKAGPFGSGDAHFVKGDNLLPYTVRFENETNATAPAQQVVITDRLTNLLDWTTFELTEIAFGDHLHRRPAAHATLRKDRDVIR